MLEQGCVHIYCGDGKGKTSAAIGLAVRAAGRGNRVAVARFLKNDDSGEIPVFEKLPGIELVPCSRSFGFVSQMDEETRRQAAVYYQKVFDDVWRYAKEENFDVLILDEIMAACNYGLVSEESVLQMLRGRPGTMEIVLTGRNPSEKLLEQADYVSEICMRKHPYTKGICAREGIEY